MEQEIYLLVYYPAVGLHILGAYKDIGHAEQARCDEMDRRIAKMHKLLDEDDDRTEEGKKLTFERWLGDMDTYLYIRPIGLN